MVQILKITTMLFFKIYKFNRGDLLQLNLSKTVPVALIIFCTEVQCCILVVGSH